MMFVIFLIHFYSCHNRQTGIKAKASIYSWMANSWYDFRSSCFISSESAAFGCHFI